mmetsp:Transcript_29410/g.70721  ORF Transcript_29410/g.70721 Transcript_29410/m.70721 type:complete len:644 (+) Transcript_29410:142-2073(+)|eukprot:CAMPEP_0113605934 /NCGR_PEP_ID=MMETSP0017_2-20120614/2591_1 /TAXON_ID=2856 /ORGANISM="Cylindrotheca closterium" /LENGTH=643 /DNA_ID=CAMNT_0000514455 /DNA_START=22 /DNA_END=1953 /DNA_ORIENTATION=+ /assembly_acc=CAM_ASM_000147
MSNPSTNNSSSNNNDGTVYRALVIDSGPIIKNTATSKLYGKANLYYTTPAVIQEIRDAKARQSLDQLPFELNEKEPSQEAMERVIAFAKQTGDYASLSKVDIQVLALCVDLEKEGCLDLEHIRTSPKRMVGLGPIKNLAGDDKTQKKEDQKEGTVEEDSKYEEEDDSDDEGIELKDGVAFFTQAPVVTDEPEPTAPKPEAPKAPMSWAKMVNPSASDSVSAVQESVKTITLAETVPEATGGGGQFDDAEDDEEDVFGGNDQTNINEAANEEGLQNELESAFPSLAAAATVPYEGSDDEEEAAEEEKAEDDDDAMLKKQKEEEDERERRKLEALKPISNSGKLYNSFRKYGDLMKPAPTKKKEVKKATTALLTIAKEEEPTDRLESRIMGSSGAAMISDMNEEDDDGEGWITCSSDIQQGRLVPKNSNSGAPANNLGPPTSQRTACTTTDFAMQNVLLQMGLPLLSVDGMKIRRLKSWVHRCGACFRVHTDAEFNGMKRLFCSHCGSDMMQRVACSIDGKTGRLKLHLKKNYRHNLRGTKFSLPKAGAGNRFQGDLLLREDQLLTGAWNQKMRMRTGGKSKNHAQSIFGMDIASNVGCHAKGSMTADDIRAGFGRRNPNSAKGRERRGKKKKSSDRACGLRRYH